MLSWVRGHVFFNKKKRKNSVMEAKRPTKTKLRVERVGVKSVGQNNERKVEAIEIEEKDRDGAGDSKKRMRDEESSNSVNENEEVPEWEEISVEKWEASTGVRTLFSLLQSFVSISCSSHCFSFHTVSSHFFVVHHFQSFTSFSRLCFAFLFPSFGVSLLLPSSEKTEND